MRKNKFYILAALFLFLFLVKLQAQQNLIFYTEGDVWVYRNDEEYFGDLDFELQQGDIIATEEDSLAIVQLASGSELKLRENTVLRFDRFGLNTSLELEKGSVFSLVNKLLSEQTYELRSRSVVAGVRGTQFFAALGQTGPDETLPDFWLCVNEGLVEIQIENTEEKVLVNPGEGINILGSRRLTDPKAYEWTKELNWNTKPQEGKVKDQTDLGQAYWDLLDQDYF